MQPPAPTSIPPARTAHRRALPIAAAVLLLVASGGGAGLVAQGSVPLSAARAEELLARAPFTVAEVRTLRPGGRARLAALRFDEGTTIVAKWVPAPRGGAADNAEPRFEVGAYRLQKLFLDEPDFVVPPTVARLVPVPDHPDGAGGVATFREAPAVLVVLQLWLRDVTTSGVWDERRLRSDSVYARHVGDLNVLTYLIRHADSNTGNFLISRDPESPRVFSVDNGIAFGSSPNPEAYEWMALRVNRLPRQTVQRLRGIGMAELEAALGVVIQLEARAGELVQVEPGANLDPGRGVRRRGGVIQLGLTSREISAVHRRLQRVLSEVDAGRISTF
jgi:hypothetical protein